MSILTIIFQMQVHLHADLVYLFISVTGIVATPMYTHSFNYLSSQQIGKNQYTHIYMLRLANNGNINLPTNIYRLMRSTGSVAVSMTSLVCFKIKPLDPH